MNHRERLNRIVKVINASSGEPMTCREVAERYLENPNSSDINTTGQILNTLYYLNVISRTDVSVGKKIRYTFGRNIAPVKVRPYGTT